MFKRFLFPDALVRRGIIPAFRLGDYLDQLDVIGRAHVEFAGNILLLRQRGQEELEGDELVLHPCSSTPAPTVIVNTLRQSGCNHQPFAAFDAQMRQLLRFAYNRPRDHRLEMNFQVSCGSLGLKPCDVQRRIMDQIPDSREGIGIMLTAERTTFDPDQPHALVALSTGPLRPAQQEQTQLHVLCRASTVQELLGAWDAVIRRLRPQFREPEWNAAMLMTLLLDMGKGGASVTLNDHAGGFTLPWPAPEWLDIPNDGSSAPGHQSVQRRAFDVPRHHFWNDAELPDWMNGRRFRLNKGRSGLVAQWV